MKLSQLVFNAFPALDRLSSSSSSPGDLAELSTVPRAYCVPGQPCFPSSAELQAINATIHGKLVAPSQPALPCYAGPAFDATLCEQATKGFTNPFWRADQPGASMYLNWNGNGSTATCPLPSSPNVQPVASCEQGRAPAYLVAATSVSDIVAGVKFASQHRLRLRIRSTGHDYLGRSSAEGSFTVSTHALKDTAFEQHWKPACKRHNLFCRAVKGRPAIRGGPGLYVEDLYKAAHANNVTVVGGVSRTVGATGGWAVGGGHGPLGRLFGMGADNILQLTVVTANGEVVIANEHQNKDLFWALRGGGGAFGVVVEVVLKAHPLLKGVIGVFGTLNVTSPSLYPAFLTKWIKAHRSFDAVGMTGYNYLQRPVSQFVHLLPIPSDAPGSLQEWQDKAVDAFQEFETWVNSTNGGVKMQKVVVRRDNYFDFWNGPFAAALGNLDAVGLNLLVASRLIHHDTLYDDAKLSSLSTAFSTSPVPLITHFVSGGAISSVRPSSTSLHPSWRDSLFVVEPVVAWPVAASPAQISGARNLLTNVTELIGAVSGYPVDRQAGYSNEANPDEKDWKQVFWSREHYEQLMKIKKRWDADGVYECFKCVGSDVFGD